MSIHAANFPSSLWDGESANRPDRGQDKSPDYRDWDAAVAEILAVQNFLLNGAGAAATGTPNGTGVSLVGSQSQIQTVTLTLAAASISTTDHTTNGADGGLKILDLPEGNILILGAVANLTTLAGAGGLADTAALVWALGSTTVGGDNATLTGTEANIIPSTTGTLSGGAGTFRGASTAPVTLDGTVTPADVYLNVAVVDAGTSANDTVAVTGTITISFVNLGDHA